jgi:HD superfamily phosphohydrolase YqeK
MNKAVITKQVKSIMSKTRYAHTVRVTHLAVKIANKVAPKLAEKVFIAAMFHDVSKEFSDDKTIKLVKK